MAARTVTPMADSLSNSRLPPVGSISEIRSDKVLKTDWLDSGCFEIGLDVGGEVAGSERDSKGSWCWAIASASSALEGTGPLR